jgi:hypothetical protein
VPTRDRRNLNLFFFFSVLPSTFRDFFSFHHFFSFHRISSCPSFLQHSDYRSQPTIRTSPNLSSTKSGPYELPHMDSEPRPLSHFLHPFPLLSLIRLFPCFFLYLFIFILISISNVHQNVILLPNRPHIRIPHPRFPLVRISSDFSSLSSASFSASSSFSPSASYSHSFLLLPISSLFSLVDRASASYAIDPGSTPSKSNFFYPSFSSFFLLFCPQMTCPTQRKVVLINSSVFPTETERWTSL